MTMLDFSKLRKRAGDCVSDSPFTINKAEKNKNDLLMKRPRFANNPKYINSFQKQTKIIDIIVSMEKAQQPIGPMQLVGALTHAYGIESSTILEYLNAIGSLERKGVISPKWTGRCFEGPMKAGLPKKIEDILMNGDPLTSSELIRMIYPGTDDSERKRRLDDVNLVCNLLDTMGWITKLPADSTMQHNNYRWVHESCRRTPETIPRWNVRYALLKTIDECGPISKSGLMKEPAVICLVSVHMTNISKELVSTQVDNALDGLRSQNLVEVEILSGQRATQCFGITDQGHRMLKRTSDSNYLDERLRRLLLESKQGIRPSQADRADRIIRWLRVLIEMDKGYGKAHMITKRLGENEGYVRGIVNGGASPCARMSDERLISECLPAALAHSEEYGKRLEEYIKERNRESDRSD
jgi:hypothetical protein